YNEPHRTASCIDRHQHPSVATVIAQLHRMGDVADTDVALRRGDDLAGFDAAAALDQFAVEAGFLEVSISVGHKLGLINGHCDRIDHAAALVFGPSPTGC